jgi:hypothetical protein
MDHLQLPFTPLPALAGGALIGLAASALLLLLGQVAGISGIMLGVLRPTTAEWPWRAAFVLGLFGGGLAWSVLDPSVFGRIPRPLPLVVVAGLIVGYGVTAGGGCTSGHGVCGLSRWSRRSLVATCTFMTTGVLTVAAWRLVTGAGL